MGESSLTNQTPWNSHRCIQVTRTNLAPVTTQLREFQQFAFLSNSPPYYQSYVLMVRVHECSPQDMELTSPSCMWGLLLSVKLSSLIREVRSLPSPALAAPSAENT